MTESVYIIDCDGVLYPESELALRKIVDAMKKIYRENIGLSGEQQRKISEESINKKHLGVFNYIKDICDATGYDFKKYCQEMAAEIDYNSIEYNAKLKDVLLKTAKQNKVVIFSNNSFEHIDKVLQKVFKQSAASLQQENIEVYDIAQTKRDGYFHPKQSEHGFEYFLEKHRLSGEDCLLFDDAQTNLSVAKRLGIKGYLVTPENSLEKLLTKLQQGQFKLEKNYGQAR